jgi:hypothetical protein
MLSRLRTIMVAAVVAALGALTSGPAARANIVFDFSGVCTDGCSGTATGVLTLTSDYIFGDNLTPATFVSVSYASSDLVFTIPAASAPALAGGLNANGSFNSLGLIFIQNATDLFSAGGGGAFSVRALSSRAVDTGSPFQFSLVAAPEPGPWALMTIGFAALGMVGMGRRLRRSKDADRRLGFVAI